MKMDLSFIRSLSRKIEEIAPDVQSFLNTEENAKYELSHVQQGIAHCVRLDLDETEENLREWYTTPTPRSRRLVKLLNDEVPVKQAIESTDPLAIAVLERAERETAVRISSEIIRTDATFQPELGFGNESVFSGHKSFSNKKLGAMIEYLTSKGHFVFRTNLNKLLYYADLTYFYLRGEGISGSVYLVRPLGPVSDAAKPTLNDLLLSKRVRVEQKTKHFVAEPKARLSARALNKNEKKLLDWILKTYGGMGAREISDFSHEENGYKNTEANKPIAYAHCESFTHLPSKSLLD